jgi:hypothetical protein
MNLERLPFSVLTTTHSLLVVADRNDKNLWTYDPHLGVLHGLGHFDDNPSLFTPLMLQVITAPEPDVLRMKMEWERAARKNTRYGGEDCVTREGLPPDAPLPFIPALGDPVFLSDIEDETTIEALNSFEECCAQIAECDAAILLEEAPNKPAKRNVKRTSKRARVPQ